MAVKATGLPRLQMYLRCHLLKELQGHVGKGQGRSPAICFKGIIALTPHNHTIIIETWAQRCEDLCVKQGLDSHLPACPQGPG